jgi:hypothetical protein
VEEVVAETVGALDLHTNIADTVRDQLLALGSTPAGARAVSVMAAKASGNTMLDKLAPFYTAGVDRAPISVLLLSPPSFGKSFAIRLLGKLYDSYYEHGCSKDMAEIDTMLGSVQPDGRGGFMTVDGVMASAFRAASEGKNTLLFLDEVLRLNPIVQEWLLSIMVPHHTPSGRVYRLRTRRVESDGSLEVIEAPAKHLAIVAGGNLDMTTPLEAFWSRWEKVRVEYSVALAETQGKAILDMYGVREPEKLIATFARVMDQSRATFAAGNLKYPVDFRILERACIMVQTSGQDVTGRNVGTFAASRIVDSCAHWSVDTGNVDSGSKSACDGWVAMLKGC